MPGTTQEGSDRGRSDPSRRGLCPFPMSVIGPRRVELLCGLIWSHPAWYEQVTSGFTVLTTIPVPHIRSVPVHRWMQIQFFLN
jgi:hypothetical protein